PEPFNIDTAVNPRRPLPGMTSEERAAAGVQLTAHGLSARQIADIFSVTTRTVARWRAAARTTQAA
ncbi:helix-turn-helix domain-containing protein, partial [Streptomyces scopuliridis]|uniref:helix-turn-helix domain-containing protein n=1 Tax=Streptomyces scopuliridis TaxID=452529 RepID=UPI0019D2B774